MKTYKAPWGTSLKVISVLTTIILIVAALSMIGIEKKVVAALGWSLFAVIAGGALFGIRGYSVDSDLISVHRLFWKTRLPIAGLESVRFEPDAMRRSLRLFGNGGLFSFTGLYRNKSLGSYRAFVTDRHQTVVLHFPKRDIVLSPSSPEEFVREVDAKRAASGTPKARA